MRRPSSSGSCGTTSATARGPCASLVQTAAVGRRPSPSRWRTPSSRPTTSSPTPTTGSSSRRSSGSSAPVSARSCTATSSAAGARRISAGSSACRRFRSRACCGRRWRRCASGSRQSLDRGSTLSRRAKASYNGAAVSVDPGIMKSVEEYLELPYHVSVLRDGAGTQWDARVEELPGCAATGRTPEEAVAGVRSLMSTWLTDALEKQEEIPGPRAEELPSGKLLVRMPRTLHADLARAADTEGVSLNQLIVGALTSAVAWRRAGSAAAPAPASRSRTLTIVLWANLAVLAVAAAVAVAALVAALS